MSVPKKQLTLYNLIDDVYKKLKFISCTHVIVNDSSKNSFFFDKNRKMSIFSL